MRAVQYSTALRLSIAGGGTDLPEYQSKHGCHLLAAGMNLRVSITVRERADGLLSVNGSPTAPVASEPSVIGAIMRKVRPEGADVKIVCPVSAGAGLGGSGAVTTALVAALLRLRDWPREPDRMAVAQLAYTTERRDFGARIGLQDHVAAVYGGLVRLRITKTDEVSVVEETTLLENARRMCEQSFLLMDTTIRRSAGAVLSGLASALEMGTEGAVSRVAAIGSLLPDIQAAIAAHDVRGMGELMHRHWEAKRVMNQRASGSLIDGVYERARSSGAYGGKVVGAGAGGFLLLLCAPENRDSVARELESLGLRRQDMSLEPVGLRCDWADG